MLVIFDLGETLVDYEGVALDWSEHYRSAIVEALNDSFKVKEEFIAAAENLLLTYNSRRNPRLSEVREGEVTLELSKLLGVEYQPFERKFFGYFQRKSSLVPGALETIQELKRRKFHLAVLSDVPYGMPIEFLKEDLNLLVPYFDEILSSCHVGFRKPSGKGILEIVERSGIEKAKALYVGNERKDIEAAIAADIMSILIVRNSDDLPNFGQSKTVRSLSEIPLLINEY